MPVLLLPSAQCLRLSRLNGYSCFRPTPVEFTPVQKIRGVAAELCGLHCDSNRLCAKRSIRFCTDAGQTGKKHPLKVGGTLEGLAIIEESRDGRVPFTTYFIQTGGEVET